MAISISSQTFQAQPAPSIHQGRGVGSRIKQDVQSLNTALQAGDLATAQKSYTDLQKLLQGNAKISQASSSATTPESTSSTTSPLDTLREDFQGLGQALQAKDLAAARKDYEQLATDSQPVAAQRGSSHHRSLQIAPSQDVSPDPASTSQSTATSATPQFSFSPLPQFGTFSPAGASSGFDQLKKDFKTIGHDLASGNLSGVQKDLAQLVKDGQQLAESLFGNSGATQGGSSVAASQYSLSASFDSESPLLSPVGTATTPAPTAQETAQVAADNSQPAAIPAQSTAETATVSSSSSTGQSNGESGSTTDVTQFSAAGERATVTRDSNTGQTAATYQSYSVQESTKATATAPTAPVSPSVGATDNQVHFSASYQSFSTNYGTGKAAATYQAFSFDETIDSTASNAANGQSANTYHATFHASFQSQNVSFLG